MADPAQQRELVGLEAHPGPAAVAEAAAGQLALHLLDRDGEAGGQAFDDHDESLAVGFPGGQEAEHPGMVPAGPSALGGVSGR